MLSVDWVDIHIILIDTAKMLYIINWDILKGQKNYCFHFNKFLAILEGYYDANWVTDNDEINSTTGYAFLLEGGAISWKFAKQTWIVRSTMESKFIVFELAEQEAKWIKSQLGDDHCGGHLYLCLYTVIYMLP